MRWSFSILAAFGLYLAAVGQATAGVVKIGVPPAGSGYVEGITDARDNKGAFAANLDTQRMPFMGPSGTLVSSYHPGNGVTSTYNTSINTGLAAGATGLTANVSGFAQVLASNDGGMSPTNTVHSATSFWSTEFTADSRFSVTLHLDASADLGHAHIVGAADALTQALLNIDDGGSGHFVRLSLNGFQLFSATNPQGPNVTYRATASDGTSTTANSITAFLPAGTYTFSASFNATAEFGANDGSGFVSGSGEFTDPQTSGSGDVSLSPAVAPEPATVTLLSIGIACMAGYGWRRRKPAIPSASA